ncbi:MAG: DUF1194 domain-containing protein [Alphaproteobacteria bacterium]|nr:DUF1194 domain-containing protein [Alphaproteobacteria bacterium]
MLSASAFSIARADAKGLIPVDLELVLAIDISGSVDDEEARLQRDGYVAALESEDIIRAVMSGMLGRIAITYIEYAGAEFSDTVVGWTLISGAEEAQAFARKVAAAPIRTEVWTSISGAIEFALPQFATNAFEGTRQVIDVSGDGPNNTGGLVTAAREAAQALGVTVNGLPIINGRISPSGWPQMKDLDLYYKDCVITGPASFIVVADSFQDFARAIRRKLILEIANATPVQAEVGPLWRVSSGRAKIPCDVGEKRIEDIWKTY